MSTIMWLNKNINKLSPNNSRKDMPWAWDYDYGNGIDVNIFFLRKNDALKFIKEFSELGKPENIYDKR